MGCKLSTDKSGGYGGPAVSPKKAHQDATEDVIENVRVYCYMVRREVMVMVMMAILTSRKARGHIYCIHDSQFLAAPASHTPFLYLVCSVV